MRRAALWILLVAAGLLAQMQLVCAAGDLAGREELAMKAAVSRVAPSVLRVETVGAVQGKSELGMTAGPTSALVISEDGYLASSGLGFESKPDSILVTLPSGKRSAARLVATDRSRNFVLLKVETTEKLPMPEAAPLSEVRVGQWAIAVGRTFESAQPNVSVGIVSALGRIWGKAVQTDAKISPSNYGGPLLDIHGRVIGVLAPMAADSGGDVTGVEWYDSGIGFAVPLEHILKVLPRLKKGEDLRGGLLGISMASGDLFGEPAKVAAVRRTSNAFKAGLRKGDEIVELDGRKVTRVADLRFALNSRYAGDKLRVIVNRGGKRIESEIELVAELIPYQHPFLGILPVRRVAGKPDGLRVRYVYSESPAAKAGIHAQDQIIAAAGQKITSADGLLGLLSERSPQDKITLKIKRGEQELELQAELAAPPEILPGELPPAIDPSATAQAKPDKSDASDIKIPEFANTCKAYVPDTYRNAAAAGLVVWLHAPGKSEWPAVLASWKPICDKRGLILIAPQANDSSGWQLGELRYVRRLIDHVIKTYTIDKQRVVVAGHEAGGTLAYLVAFTQPETIRAVAVNGAELPRGAQLPENDPLRRLDIYTTLAANSPQSPDVEAGIKKLREMKYPVTVKEIGAGERTLTADELAELGRWIDALDRI